MEAEAVGGPCDWREVVCVKADDELKRLRSANAWALRAAKTLGWEEVWAGMKSEDGEVRLRHLMALQELKGRAAYTDRFLGRLVEIVLGDEDEDCRWQAAIAMGLDFAHHHSTIWDCTWRLSQQRRGDAVAIAGAVFLEHLLDAMPVYLPMAEELARRDRRFLEVFRMNWNKGSALRGKKGWKQRKKPGSQEAKPRRKKRPAK